MSKIRHSNPLLFPGLQHRMYAYSVQNTQDKSCQNKLLKDRYWQSLFYAKTNPNVIQGQILSRMGGMRNIKVMGECVHISSQRLFWTVWVAYQNNFTSHGWLAVRRGQEHCVIRSKMLSSQESLTYSPGAQDYSTQRTRLCWLKRGSERPEYKTVWRTNICRKVLKLLLCSYCKEADRHKITMANNQSGSVRQINKRYLRTNQNLIQI